MAEVSESAKAKRYEIGVTVLLLGVLAPLLAVGVVAAYGFIVWIWQMIAGPPGPPPA